MKKTSFLTAAISIAVMAFAMQSFAQSGKENPVLGRFPYIYYEFEEKGDKLADLWEAKIENSETMGEYRANTDKYEDEKRRHKASKPVAELEQSLAEIAGRDVPFDWTDDGRLEIEYIRVREEQKKYAVESGKLELEVGIKTLNDQKTYDSYDRWYYLVLDSMGEPIIKGYLQPFYGNSAFGDGKTIELKCAKYDFRNMALVKFITKEEFDQSQAKL